MSKNNRMYLTQWLRVAVLLSLAFALSACDSGSTDNSSFTLPMPQIIRNVAQVNQAAVGAQLLTTTGTVALTRDGDNFTGSIVVQPGVEFSYRIIIFELVDGERLELATQEGRATVSEDTAIEVGDAYVFPDLDNDSFSNLDERIAQSDPSNSFSTPDNIAGPPTSAGLAQFAQAQFSVTEDSGTLAIQVLRVAGSEGAVSARYELSAETASADDDFRAASGLLNWADGDTAPRTIFISVFSDDQSEGTETFIASLFAVSGGLAIGNGTARISIEDSTPPPEPGTIQFAVSELNTSEDAGSVDITVERVGGSDNAVSVEYSFSDGTAINNADYTGVDGTLNWTDGDSSPRIVTVPIATDSDIEALETFTVTLSTPIGGATIDNAITTVSIADSTPTPEPGQLVLSASNYSFSEGTTGTITVQRTNGADGAQTVDYAFIAGSATADQDFTAQNGQLSWADGDTSARQITIVVNSDNQIEPAETLTIQFSNPVGGASLPTTSATITLNDATPIPVPGNVQLTAPSFSVAEGASVEISVERLNGQDGPISIDYSLVAGSAELSTDFSDANGTLNWTDGDTGNRTFSVSALNDATIEADETFTVMLSNPGGGTTTLRSTAIVTITDTTPPPQPGTIAFAAQSGAINEGQTRSIIVQRSNGSDGAVTIDYQTQAGTAGASDFVATSGQLSWADGDSSDRTIDITASNDALVEESESFELQLSAPGGGAALGQAALTLTITDTTVVPEPGLLEFVASDGLVSEGGTITLQVARRNGSDGPVSVVWSSADGSATAADYNGGSATLQWADGDTSNRSFEISTIQDSLVEGDENLTVSLSSASGGASIGLASLTITIVDTTVPPVPGTLSFISEQSSVTEGNSASIEVGRSGGSDGPVEVSYSISSTGTASDDDYSIAIATLSWSDGDTGNRTIPVTAATDALTEGPETVVLTLSNATNGSSIGTSATHTLTINDVPPDPVTLAFASASSSVTEGSSATIAVSRSGGSDGEVSVSYTIAGTADDSDYNITEGTLTWADGDSTDQTISVTAVTDSLTEGPETVVLTLSNATNNSTIGSTATHTLTINDVPPDPVTLAFASASSSVTEGSSATIAVSRSGGSDGEVSVGYTIDGTADDSDHNITEGTLTWADGDSTDQTIPVTAATDSLTEGPETVVLTLSNATNGSTIGSTATHTLTINDATTQASGVLSVEDTSVDVSEGNTATMTVSRTGGSDGAVSVSVMASDGTATTGDDFTFEPTLLEWADGDSADKTIELTANADAELEPTAETVVLTLSSPSGGATLDTDTGTFTINDVQAGQLQFIAATASVNEGESVDVTIERINGSDGEVTVTVTVVDQSADASDHDAVPDSLTFADGSADSQTITITATTDTDIEGDETFQITLSDPTGGATLGQATIDITITDVPPTVKFASLDSDAQWQVCYESTDPYGASAWSTQPDSNGLDSACVKRCSDNANVAALPGWGFDLSDQHACAFSDAKPGSIASVAVYDPQRVSFANPISPWQLAPDSGTWQCQLQSRPSGDAEFVDADEQLHFLAFRSDGSYRYGLASTTQPDQTSIDELGVWSIDNRTLELDHLATLHRNVQFEAASMMSLYVTDTLRYSCHR